MAKENKKSFFSWKDENNKTDNTEEPKEEFLGNTTIEDISVENDNKEDVTVEEKPQNEPVVEKKEIKEEPKKKEVKKERTVADLSQSELRQYQRTGVIPK